MSGRMIDANGTLQDQVLKKLSSDKPVGFLSALIQGSALYKNFQDLLVISSRARSALFDAALCETLTLV